MDSQPRYAFFDLDHTILPQDTQALFARFVMTRQPWRRIYLLWYLPTLIPGALKLLKLRTMKRIFFSYLFGMPGKQLLDLAEEFATTIVPKVAYPEIVAEVERLKSEGYTMILNSASPEFYVEKIAKQFGFDHYLGTDLILEDKMPFLPSIVGPNNKYAAKITAMQTKGLIPEGHNWEEDEPFPDSWAFSDSHADIPLLSIAEHGVTIHPGEKLLAKAKQKDWAIRHPKQPYRGKWGGRLATLSLALGLGGKYLKPTK